MSLVTLASRESAQRGYEYYQSKKVLSLCKLSDTEMTGTIKGSGNTHYEVFIDTLHPRKSKCNCPHADGKRIICKHIIALYFTAYPKEAEKFYDEVKLRKIEEEKRQEELENKIIKFVKGLKKEELQNIILDLLNDGPEWQYDSFVDIYIEE